MKELPSVMTLHHCKITNSNQEPLNLLKNKYILNNNNNKEKVQYKYDEGALSGKAMM